MERSALTSRLCIVSASPAAAFARPAWRAPPLSSLIDLPSLVRRFFRTTFLLIDGVLVALFVLGFTTRYIHPGWLWWTELLATAVPYLGLLLVLPALVLLQRRRWKGFGLHVALLLLLTLRVASVPRLLHRAEASSGDLKLMTYNVPPWFGYQMPEKRRTMAAFIDSLRPDVVALQEARIGYHPDAPYARASPYLSVLFDSLAYQTLGPRIAAPEETRQPVLSRFSVVRRDHTRLQFDDPEWPATKPFTRTILDWHGRRIAVYNLHLFSFGAEKPWKDNELGPFDVDRWRGYLRQYRHAFQVRAGEAQKIRRILGQERLPFIVCGDLNSTPHNWVYGHLVRGLNDAFRVAGGGWGMTYHSRLPFARIDFVLVSDDWEVVSAEVLDSGLSDHRPLWTTLRLKDAAR